MPENVLARRVTTSFRAATPTRTRTDFRPRRTFFAAWLAGTAAVVAVAVASVVSSVRDGVVGFDFLGTLWDPATAIRHGVSPYPPAVADALASGNPNLYPPLPAFVTVPFTFLPWRVGLALWITLLLAAVCVGLRLIGVRDWRCFVLAVACPAVWSGLVLGNLILVLFLGVAAAWHWRSRPGVTGVVLGVTIAAKLVTLPLLIWLIAARRYKAAGWAVATAFVAILAPWGALGFRGLRDYPSLLRVADDVYAPHGFSLAASADALGAGGFRSTACLGAAALALGAAVSLRRRSEHAVFAFAVLASVLASSIAWPYTFVLLLAPLAVARVRLSAEWLLFPILMIVAAALPHPDTPSAACCRPSSTPSAVWNFDHLPPSLVRPIGFALVSLAIVAMSVFRGPRADRSVDRGHPTPATLA